MDIDKQHETLFFKLQKFSVIKQAGHKIQTIAEVFSILETNKHLLNIESYLLSETTLEQIFMSFAKHSNPYNLPSLRTAGADESIYTTFGFDTKTSMKQFDETSPKAVSIYQSAEPIYYQPSDNSSNSFIHKLRKKLKQADDYEVKF